MDYFYSHFEENIYNLLINEYLIVKNADGAIIDRLCWTEEGYRRLNYTGFYSEYFGNVKAKKNDPYQAIVCDSFINNKITMVKGPAGTGKTYLSLAFLMNYLEKGKIDKVIIFCNTVATKDSARLGFLPGTRDEKLLDSQIGNLLSSKLGGKEEVEKLIEDGKLILLPMSDIRGYDTSGMRAGVYISEAQNMSVNLMKLALQRIGEDSVCIIDGDCKAQVDDDQFAGTNNGMKRASKIFRGHDIYAEITLQNIYRSKIGQIAELM
jgi:predicted ribonuclease YlaK